MKWLLLPSLLLAFNGYAAVPLSPVADRAGADVLAKIENEHLKVSFLEAMRGGKASARPVVQVRTQAGWVVAPLDASAESYQVLSASDGVTLEIPTRGFHPRWSDKAKAKSAVAQVIWNAGKSHEAIVSSVTQLDARHLRLRFHPLSVGSLEAIWALAPGDRSVKVSLQFSPTAAGQYSLGYFLFTRKPIEEVDELLLPMLVNAKRFPSKEYTLLQTQCPTPVSLMQVGAMTWAVSGDRSSTPFEFPTPAESRYGLHIRNPSGQVQPSIYGPLVGTPGAHASAGQPLEFVFRVLVQPGDWYAAYRTVADEVFGWRDYRVNGQISLTEAALNMIDLYLDDERGGWWERAKAPYQVESKNGSTQSSPMTAVSLYRLTGDRELYRRRTLPTLEFMLSRDGPHFSPIPGNTGGYPKGSMKGPVDIFGSTVFGGLWELMNRRTPVLRDIAFPQDGIRGTRTQQNYQTHNQPFDEWLGRYLITGDQTALDRAIREADEYIAAAIARRPGAELGIQPFFLMAYTPAWEGLLRLYEVTGEKRFLDAAAFGARMVMTGMWTQPTPIPGNVVVHPGNFCHGDKLDRLLHKGESEFRLGWPRQAGDTPERKTPGWLASNVGLGFEQPTTYTYRDNGGRMIFQAPWTAAFLRLTRYTGDRQFETYARNAVVGRWGNYPGYYYTTFTDLMQNPRYPHVGPDMGFFYYHHIIVHLSWTLDYLVSAANLRSEGGIRFPGLRQFGYAYFDNLVYGHAPGEVLGEKDAWLWLRRDLVRLDNPQINFLTVHNGKSFFVVLMNESREAENVKVAFAPANIDARAGSFRNARFLAGGSGEVGLSENVASVQVAPRGLTVLAIDNLYINVPAHHSLPAPQSSGPAGSVTVALDEKTEVRAAAIQIEPGFWDAYVWSTAGSGQLREISLTWTSGSQTKTIRDTDYPYEFSVSVPRRQTSFTFTTSGLRADGTSFSTPSRTIGVAESNAAEPTLRKARLSPDRAGRGQAGGIDGDAAKPAERSLN